MIVCPACGQENPDGFRFCGACASPLDAGEGEPAREVRKTVTVVFCDMVGSTALGDATDPERVRTLMAGYHDLARTILERHGGTVEKFIGDAVMAVFGVPVLREDDALRAVRAVVEMRDELAAAGIPVRIGVNTGEVVAGRGEALVTGDAVNVAARLEQAAGTGEVLIGETTFRLTRNAVEAEPVEGLVAKGKPEPLEARRLVSVSAQAQAIPRRADAPLVGRALELNMLAEAFTRSVSERRCHLFTVMGAAGVGKSRLVAELAAGAAAGADFLVGQCLPYGEGITFWPVAEMLRSAAGIGERDDREAARAALERLVADDEDGMLVAERVACAIGLGGPPAEAEEVFWALRRTFELVAQRRPTVLVFEDVHWAEPTLLDLIDHMADWARGGPLLIICTARPDLLDIRPAWAGGKTNATTVLLERLPEADCEALLDELAGDLELSADERQRVVAASEGNPLFVEQMLAMLGDGAPGVGDVPPTIQALLSARLDRLEGEERLVVERASVEGRVFHRGALAALAPDAARPALAAHLQRLMRRELIDLDHSLFQGDSAYRFQHVLIRDAAYASLPKRTRAELHERFAEWLEERVAHRIDEYREILAHHFEQAHTLLADVAPDDPRLPALAARAVSALAVAADHAEQRGDTAAAAATYTRAVALPQAEDAAAADLLISAARAAHEKPDRDACIALAARAEAIAQAAGDEVRTLHARVVALDAQLQATSRFPTAEARAIAETAAERFEATGEGRRLVDALFAVAETYHFEGHWGLMHDPLERAAAVARGLDDPRLEQEATAALLGSHFWGEGSARTGLDLAEEHLRRWPHSPAARLRGLGFRARFLAVLGRFDEARQATAQWLEEAERIGSRQPLLTRAFTTAVAADAEGDYETAAAECAWSIERLEEAGLMGLVATLYGFRAVMLAHLGRMDEAEAAAEAAREASHPDDLDAEAIWRCGAGAARAGLGDPDGGIALLEEAVAIIDRTDELVFQGNTRLLLSGVVESRDPARARVLAEEALALYRRKEAPPYIARAEARLAELGAAETAG